MQLLGWSSITIACSRMEKGALCPEVLSVTGDAVLPNLVDNIAGDCVGIWVGMLLVGDKTV